MVVGYCCAWLDVGCGGFNGCCRCAFAARLCLWLVIVILLFWLFDGCFVVAGVGFAGFIVFCFDLVVACCLCVFLRGAICLVGCVVNSVFVGWRCLFI